MKMAFSVGMSEDIVRDINQYMLYRLSSKSPEELEGKAKFEVLTERKELNTRKECLLELVEQRMGSEFREELEDIECSLVGIQIDAGYLNGVRDGMRLWSALNSWISV